jgi:hypothetical protein
MKKGRESSGRGLQGLVTAGAAVVGGELGSSLYRLLEGRTRPIGVRSGSASP